MNLEDKKETQTSSTATETKQETAVAKDSKDSRSTISTANANFTKKPFRPQDRNKTNKDRPQRARQDFRKPKEQSDFQEKVIWIRRINKVTTGGRRLRFSAAVVVGNKKGTVGLGVAKANEVNDAIKKAVAAAHKNLKQVAINKDSSIYHHGMGTYCASKILLKPAKEGIGVKAGGSARDVVELAGIQNIYSKSLGSNNKINLARATINGLSSLKSAEFFQTKNSKRRVVPTEATTSEARK